MSNIGKSIDYHEGFRRGFNEGLMKGIENAEKMIQNSKRPIEVIVEKGTCNSLLVDNIESLLKENEKLRIELEKYESKTENGLSAMKENERSKTVKNFETMSFREEIPIEELKELKHKMDTWDVKSMEYPIMTEYVVRMLDTAVLNHVRFKQEHQLSKELARALLETLAVFNNNEFKDKYIPLLERAKDYKCFELKEEGLENLSFETILNIFILD